VPFSLCAMSRTSSAPLPPNCDMPLVYITTLFSGIERSVGGARQRTSRASINEAKWKTSRSSNRQKQKRGRPLTSEFSKLAPNRGCRAKAKVPSRDHASIIIVRVTPGVSREGGRERERASERGRAREGEARHDAGGAQEV
jgi:hypothetical protein